MINLYFLKFIFYSLRCIDHDNELLNYKKLTEKIKLRRLDVVYIFKSI